MTAEPRVTSPVGVLPGPAGGERLGGPKAQRTRQTILAAARRLFGERGYRRTTMTDIAVAAGVAQGTVYLYFRDRTDLVVAMLQDGLNEMVTRVDTTLRPAEGSAGLERILTNYARAYAEAPDMVRVWEEVVHVEEHLAEVRRSIGRAFEAAVEEGLRAGQKQGLVRKDLQPAATSRALCAMADRYCYLTYVFDPPGGVPPQPKVVGRLLARLWASALGLGV